ncbi:cytochrome c peroxidase [Leptospira interrogans]|uniref:Di-heme cytochrome C peroxidase n=14 Tax=Leptospira interrogans TaxID=173 RepID=A0A0E2D3F8_LEPIR|nr:MULTISPECIES: cytochrome c peroxidase [Leptospira]EMF74464.1 di-heme cytochrome C peroxidase [Leptospira interrogans serovar Canicola str. LT1962]EMG09187.1 di-heme cytochrome C peroxidase [Leptospira interrogans serovar Grippotyphosa str. LT2186]EMG20304.1 di-heme cytochrome C peroxidase [Leptospira interrogans serovar Copenhageni str. LT2050]EMM81799.1 di-heme cytochrome C peroxidase [Leptospira interrogans str. 2006001854]EMM94365.1 di-heme cytochrome C peroxidase [Leptospira interrogans
MKPSTAGMFYLTFLGILLVTCGPSEKTKKLIDDSKKIFGTIPDKMPGGEVDTPELIQLGEKLYFEKRLSANDTQSCNSCHNVVGKAAGVDNLPTSPGAFGKNGVRNSPTVLNAGFHIAQFWDGRAKDLKEQAKGPILNPVEMAMPSASEVEKKIGQIPEYQELFAKAYPDSLTKENSNTLTRAQKITYDNITGAIAAFERTLKTQDRFDDFQKGNHKALSIEEQEGLEKFIATGCITCHVGPLLGGNSFRKLGQINPYENSSDKGRQDLTKNSSDAFVFKVPSLRNVAITGPYFHDGKITTLEEAVKKMAHLQLGKDLSDSDTKLIVTFLKTLTDKNRSN